MPELMSTELTRPERRSVQMQSCLWTRMERTAGNKRCCRLRSLLTRVSAGLRSRFLLMTWKACGCCAIALRREWTLPQGNMDTTQAISGACSTPAPWTCCRRTQPGAEASRVFFRPQPCARRTICRFRPTLLQPCTCTWAARQREFVTWNIFTIMFVSNGCFLTAFGLRWEGNLPRIFHVQEWELN